jgi:hypothetical protein
MIISVEDVKKRITTNLDDSVLEEKLQALEVQVREYTNNRFLKKPYVRINADIQGGVFMSESLIPFKVGDTVQVSVNRDAIDCGVYTVKEITGNTFTVNEDVDDITNTTVSLVQYKADVRIGVVELLDWKLKNADKVGLSAETISRHSQTFDRTSIDKNFGVPNDLLAFLKPYKNPRF